MSHTIDVRQLSAAELHLAIDWARQEGWNPGTFDAACFYAADPNGFFVSLHNDEPAAIVSVVRYGTSFSFLGLYICRPDLRGRGYGTRVWQAGLRYAGPAPSDWMECRSSKTGTRGQCFALPGGIAATGVLEAAQAYQAWWTWIPYRSRRSPPMTRPCSRPIGAASSGTG
jgi:hypothetical protein